MEQAHRPDPAAGVGFPERTAFIRRAAARLCLRLGWAPLHEVRLANGRRADILALQPGGGFVCIEVKSGLRDYMADGKWTEYQPFCAPRKLLFQIDKSPMSTGRFFSNGAVRKWSSIW